MAPFFQTVVDEDEVALLRDGAEAFPAMLEAIRAARLTVCMETYIFVEDATGIRFADALMERARAGVEVSLLYDDWGSDLSESLVERMRAAGVRVVAFRPVRFTGRLGNLLAHLRRRNHRKSLIVDGLVGFTGGLNISDEYAAVEHGGRGWRDTHVRLRGPAVGELQYLFNDVWRRSKGVPLTPGRYCAHRPRTSTRVRIVGNDFAKSRKHIRVAYQKAITAAKHRIHLTHAYFLPPERLMRALTKAARRGVRVTVILAATTDVKLVYLAARGLYGRLLRAGVRVFEWRGRVLHAKTAVVDGRWATVGSANLDPLSLRVNLEVNAVIEDEKFGAAAEAMFALDLQNCDEITLERWNDRPYLERWLSWLALRLRAFL